MGPKAVNPSPSDMFAPGAAVITWRLLRAPTASTSVVAEGLRSSQSHVLCLDIDDGEGARAGVDATDAGEDTESAA